MKEVTFSLPKGETTLRELRMAGYVFFIGVNRDTPMLIYKSVYLDGKLGSLGESVAYRRENDDKVKHNYNHCIVISLLIADCIWTTINPFEVS